MRGWGGSTDGRSVTEEIEDCLRSLRAEADRAERARRNGSVSEAEAAHVAGRALLDRISVALLAGGTESDGTAAVLAALGASSAAEFARLEGRSDPALWRDAAQRWQDFAMWRVAGRDHDGQEHLRP